MEDRSKIFLAYFLSRLCVCFLLYLLLFQKKLDLSLDNQYTQFPRSSSNLWVIMRNIVRQLYLFIYYDIVHVVQYDKSNERKQ